MAAPELQSNKSATCLFIILGAFYHSADGCYLGKLSSSLPAARHAELSSTESGPAPARGLERWPPGHAGSRPSLSTLAPTRLCSVCSALTEQVARSPSPAPARGRHTWCRAPNYPAWQVLLGGKRRRRAAPPGGRGGGGGRAVEREAPQAHRQAAQNQGAPWGCRRRFRLEDKA